MRTVPLSGKKAAGRVALVDDEDYALVTSRAWYLNETSPGRFYARATAGAGTYMHDLIMGCTGVDHRNNDGLDNQRSNLRPATQPQNQANQVPRLGGTSRFKGVCWDSSRRKWLAQIRIDYRNHHLGRFLVEEDAARAYDAAALARWGEYAVLNFP